MDTTIVIFGASGDLTSRKLIPALYSNAKKNRLPAGTRIIGVARTPLSDDAFRDRMREAVTGVAPGPFDESAWTAFARSLSYLPGDAGDPQCAAQLATRLSTTGHGASSVLYYLATAPDLYTKVIRTLAEASLLRETEGQGFRRVVIEKPFGRDRSSALALNHELHTVLTESQIYRIDHYLGKETVQNLLVFRFGNAIFEPLWNRNYIDHVQITVAESVGVEHRAGYYDRAGILRDMVQNHLLQLVTLVAMESPVVFEADALRNEKVKVLKAMRRISPEYSARHTVRGQYEGYRTEPGVAPDSTTETFTAIKLHVENWRWQGVPFYVRSGKRMKSKATEISIQFRRPPTQILDVAAGRTELFTNRLSMCIQPDEGIHLRFLAKVPDQGLQTHPVDMDFHFRDSFAGAPMPEAYERLLLDAVNGDASLFARSDEIESSWEIIDGIREGWESDYAPPLQPYPHGSWGPPAADELLGRDGRWWVHDCTPHGTAAGV